MISNYNYYFYLFIFLFFLRFPGPCQPFKPNQTELCHEFQSLMQRDNVAAQCCNHANASCHLNISRVHLGRKSDVWSHCYCDPICEQIGDCCVDYDTW